MDNWRKTKEEKKKKKKRKEKAKIKTGWGREGRGGIRVHRTAYKPDEIKVYWPDLPLDCIHFWLMSADIKISTTVDVAY